MERTCRQCRAVFAIGQTEQAFYRRISTAIQGLDLQVPIPEHCYDCRQQRRMSWRNERTLYRRTCDYSGESLISIYRPDSGFCVYDFEIWTSDCWDAMDYGERFDFSKTFFEQFDALHRRVPLPALYRDSESENSRYTNFTQRNRNCYLTFAAAGNEDCLYSTYLQRNRDVCDSFFIFDSELCYQCIDCRNCYDLRFAQFCDSCQDSWFLYNCTNCRNCLCCSSLVNKQYCIYNEQFTREEYEKKVRELTSDRASFFALQQRLLELVRETPQKSYAGIHNEEVTGDHIFQSRRSTMCFDCTELEDCHYCTWLHKAKDCYDCYAWGLSGELGYNNHLCGDDFYHVCFSESCRGSISHLFYSRYCWNNSSHLFACVGLKNKSHCILNTQYSSDEYFKLLPRIVAHMKETGEWGRFFPPELSPFGYNETVAAEYFPLSREGVLTRGWNWFEESRQTGIAQRTLHDVSAKPSEFSTTALEEAFCCANCARDFRITSAELAFYQKMKLPLPLSCFHCRYQRRRDLRNPRELLQRSCATCQRDIVSTFTEKRAAQVYCDHCYPKIVF